jgi:hypothetical protein
LVDRCVSTIEPEPVDGFEFSVTLYNSMNMDMLRIPRQFPLVADEREEQVLLPVRGGATDIWTLRCSLTALA